MHKTIAAAWVVGGLVACSGDDTGGAGGESPSGPQTEEVAEKEPNDGPTAAGAQDLGEFSADRVVVVTGALSSGGSNGQMYTGDFDVFALNVTASGSLDVKIAWDDAADVDFGLYDANVNVVASDGTQANPAKGSLAFANGKYLLGLFSKDNAASYTATITYKKSTATGPDCPTGPVLPAAPAGGCNLTLTTAACSTADLSGGKSFELAWSTNQTFCEGPHKVYLAGDPQSSWTSGNAVEFEIDSTIGPNERQGMTRNIGGYLNINTGDIDQLTSSTGIYYYRVSDFYGALSEVRAIVIVQ